jgi:hypothetical protein
MGSVLDDQVDQHWKVAPMTTPSRDTEPYIDKLRVDLLWRMPPGRKLELVGEMTRTVHVMALAGLRQRYPDESPQQHRRRLADLLLGPELAARAYGPRAALE